MKPLFPLALASALAAMSCAPGNPITPAGTVLFEWDSAHASRKTLNTATIGAKTSKDFTITIDNEAPFVVSVHVEVAEVELTESGKTVKQTSPISIRGVVKSNTAWDLSGKCLEGPNYKMGSVNAAGEMSLPPGMLQDCSIGYHRRSGIVFKSTYELGKTLTMSGDGTMNAFTPDETKIE